MKSLGTLIDLKQRALDEKRRVLVQLQEEKERIEAEKQALRQALDREVKLASKQPDLARYFGNFAQHNENQQNELVEKMQTMQKLIDTQQDQIRRAFAELKQMEIVKQNRAEEERKEEARKETAELDEIGLRGYEKRD